MRAAPAGRPKAIRLRNEAILSPSKSKSATPHLVSFHPLPLRRAAEGGLSAATEDRSFPSVISSQSKAPR